MTCSSEILRIKGAFSVQNNGFSCFDKTISYIMKSSHSSNEGTH